jgi:anti-anti-sigma factor
MEECDREPFTTVQVDGGAGLTVHRVPDPDPRTLRLELIGELDLHSATILRPTVLASLHGITTVEITATDVTFIDSSGLRLLLDVYTSVTGSGGNVSVVAPSAPTMRVLEIAGCLRLLDVAVSGDCG